MIIYLHGFDASSPGNHEKCMQLEFIDDDVRMINYSTIHPKMDMSHILKKVHKQIETSDDPSPLICGVGLGGYWSERIGFLAGIKSVIFNPNLHPEDNMQGRIERPEEYADIGQKCVSQFRSKNADRCLVILSENDEIRDSKETAGELSDYYEIVWDGEQSHKFKDISAHLAKMKAFKEESA